jgi:Cache 3/Cache 2 fusion domain
MLESPPDKYESVDRWMRALVGEGVKFMSMKQAVVSIFAAGCFLGAATLLSGLGEAQDAKVKTAMDTLQTMAAKLGPPKVEGTDNVAGKVVPAIYFGTTKMNNNFELVDGVVKEVGGTATIFVKSGDDYVRVATNVKKDDGSRAIGTVLDPKGKAIESIKKNEAFYGEVDILGKPYVAGYDPIRDASNDVIGIYYVGYAK